MNDGLAMLDAIGNAPSCADRVTFKSFPPRSMPWDEYRAVPAWNWSLLKSGRVSMSQLAYDRTHPRKSTKALTFGSVVHCAAFEPREFPIRYTVAPAAFFDDDRLNRTRKEGKAFYEEWIAGGNPAIKDAAEYKRAVFASENPGREVVSEDDYARALAIGEAVRSNPAAAPYLSRCRHELAMAWVDKSTGLPCKGRIDVLTDPMPLVVEVDLKTAKTIAQHALEGAAEVYGYLHQRAFYADGLAAHGIDSRAVIIAVKAQPAHDVGVFRVPTEAVESVRSEIRALLDRVAECEASGRWPGMYESEGFIERPSWTIGDGDGSGFEIVEG